MLLTKYLYDEQLEEAFEHIVKGDIVKVVRRDNEHLGWFPNMNKFLGEQLTVVGRCNYGLILVDNHSRWYEFAFRSLALTEHNLKKTCIKKIGDVVYKLLYPIPIDHLKEISLGEDRKVLKEIFKEYRKITFEKNGFEQIKEKCPRIIGVLLSYDILYKTQTEEL